MHIRQFIFNPIQVNTYVLYDDLQNGIIIDAGCASLKEKIELKTFIEEKAIHIKRILCTHLHFDHILGASYIQNTFQVKAYAHQNDAYWLESMAKYAALFGIQTEESSPHIDGWLHDGEQIVEGGICLEVIHMPGHSPGGIALYARNDNVVFTGDSLFEGSIGRTDLKGGNAADLVEHIKTRLLVLPDDTMVYPGHGASTSIGVEKQYNPFVC